MKKMVQISGLLIAGLMILAHSIVPHHHHDVFTSCCEHEHQHQQEEIADTFIADFNHVHLNESHEDCSEHEHEHHCKLSFESLVKQVQFLAVFVSLSDFKFEQPVEKELKYFSDFLFYYQSVYLSTSPTRGSPVLS